MSSPTAPQKISSRPLQKGQSLAWNGRKLSWEEFVKEVLHDYWLGWVSRECSILGRREVIQAGRAKFGIFGDGKEVAQIAMAKCFRPGDWRSGYYRDQTFMMAVGLLTVEQFFAQLYADPEDAHDPHSFGRQMNNHFSTPFLDENRNWLPLAERPNSSADTSPTSSQMPRALGLALASKLYRENPQLREMKTFSHNGDEVCFATIGDASCAEGLFWETLNAAGVMQVPLAIFIWDDGYGISVPKEYQVARMNIAELLSGFQSSSDDERGVDIYYVRGWNYPELVQVFTEGIEKCRRTHRPCVFHVDELTQPQGHSTSGSHERYKPPERLQWEREMDCLKKFREWILENGIATEEKLNELEKDARQYARKGMQRAWRQFQDPIIREMNEALGLIHRVAGVSRHKEEILKVADALRNLDVVLRRDVMKAVKTVLRITRFEAELPPVQELRQWKDRYEEANRERYNSWLYIPAGTKGSAMNVEEIRPRYSQNPERIPGYQILNRGFDAIFRRDPRVVAFGEDVGKLGDVNQGFAGLQEKYGEIRIFDTGIREATIIGQAIGLAMRGLRPIAEIQYLDYLIFGLEPMTDDIATLLYRTRGTQIAPVIVRTRGHRLEGIWHTGSPIQMLLGSLRGMYLFVPRNMTQAVACYNTLLLSDEPGLIIERLNAYRIREPLPENLEEITIRPGTVEVIREGEDVTVVTYGSCVPICLEAAEILAEMGIECEVIDARCLLPFDVEHKIQESLKKTSYLVLVDEDFSGGATAFMLQKIIEEQKGFWYLDAPPVTVTAHDHRSPYGSDGDYFTKPNVERVVEAIYQLMHEVDPRSYPMFF